MKIYTKTGDKGSTALIGGKRVPKNHLRIEAYGTVDELIAHVGFCRDTLDLKDIKDQLLSVQDQLMIAAAVLATDSEADNQEIPKLSGEDIVWLENNIDRMEEKLPKLESFILPGGHLAVSAAHIARTVCRRAERCILTLSDSVDIPKEVTEYFNRLSDYLFVLSRYISLEKKAGEIPWQPRLYK